MSTWKSLVVIIRDSYKKPISPPYHHKRFPSQKLNKHLQIYGTWKNNFKKKIGGPLIFLRKFCRSSVDGGEVMNPPSSHGKPSFAGFKSLVNWTASAPRRSWLILRFFRHSTKKKQKWKWPNTFGFKDDNICFNLECVLFVTLFWGNRFMLRFFLKLTFCTRTILGNLVFIRSLRSLLGIMVEPMCSFQVTNFVSHTQGFWVNSNCKKKHLPCLLNLRHTYTIIHPDSIVD